MIALVSSFNSCGNNHFEDNDDLRDASLSDLLDILYESDGWVKVHAAEFLLWESEHHLEVKEEFLNENSQFGHQAPYRIGIWRVLAQAEPLIEDRMAWKQKILAVYQDSTATDRLHAIETLAKLKTPVKVGSNVQNEIDIDKETAPFALYSLWNKGYNKAIGLKSVRLRLFMLLEEVDLARHQTAVQIISYILRYIGPLETAHWHQLKELALHGNEDAKLRVNLLATTWISHSEDASITDIEAVKSELFLYKDDAAAANQVMMALATKGGKSELELANQLFQRARNKEDANYDAAIHVSAAYALLAMLNRIQ